MKAICYTLKPTLIAASVAMLLMMNSGSVFALGWACDYGLHLENAIIPPRPGAPIPDIEIQDVTLKYLEISSWKSKSFSNSETIAHGDEYEYSTDDPESIATCYTYKWNFEWRCEGQDEWTSETTDQTEFDGSDRDSNYFVEFGKCDSSGLNESDDT